MGPNSHYSSSPVASSFFFSVLLAMTSCSFLRSVSTFSIQKQILSRESLLVVGAGVRQQRPLFTRSLVALDASSSKKTAKTSYDVDTSDQEAEQHLVSEKNKRSSPSATLEETPPVAEPPPQQPTTVNGDRGNGTILKKKKNDRYQDVLEKVGLDQGQLQFATQLPSQRTVTPYDIFCNRELRLGGIRAVGFDMDYTLAQYKQPAFDKLSFDGAKQKLVHNLGYPTEVLEFEYDHTMWTRGLIMDTLRGNFLKIDRHKYVRVAYHGFDKMSSTTRKLLYSRTFNKVMSFSEKQYVNMDTLFQFVDAHLFACLVDLKDKGEHEFLDFRTYEEMYKHVRECIDLCHRDGVIKDEVARNPTEYIVLDMGLIPMLERFKKSGVKLFLLTNSLWEYTSTVMNFLYHKTCVDEDEQKKNEWLELFDIVIVGSCKPAYMLDPYLNLFRVRPEDGSLLNTDGTYEIDALGEDGAAKFLAQGKTFQGGNWLHLHAMLETGAGEEILYVGDHLYSDVLRSKRTLGWRSAFIMPELEEEMKMFSEEAPLIDQISALRQLREELSIYGDTLRLSKDLTEEQLEESLEKLHEEDRIIKKKLSQLAEQWHGSFHPIWGAMFNAGYQDSRFAFYVANYACLYTSRATNLGLVSSERSFRTHHEMLPHDRLLDGPYTKFEDYTDPWNQ